MNCDHLRVLGSTAPRAGMAKRDTSVHREKEALQAHRGRTVVCSPRFSCLEHLTQPHVRPNLRSSAFPAAGGRRGGGAAAPRAGGGPGRGAGAAAAAGGGGGGGRG